MYVHNMSYMYVMPSYVRMPFTLVYDPIFVPFCTPYHFFCPSVCLCYFWPFTFIEKSDCGKINFVLYVISVVMILVKLLQVIWGYITCFVVCQSFCPSLCLYLWKICVLYDNGVMSSMLHFMGTWSSSCKRT